MTQAFDTDYDTDFGPNETAMAAYLADGEARALTLGNRGPIRFTANGEVDPSILAAYKRHGFYVFTGVIDDVELADIERDLFDMLERAPVTRGAAVDATGRPALGADCEGRTCVWVKPLSDPAGGTATSNGRHPVQMFEPTAPADAPDYVLQLILGSLQFSDACLRLYGHPDLLRVAAAVNGDDFAPFNEAVWIKRPHLGGSVAWHQDGTMQWDADDFDEGTHGFNFMAQLYGCTPANGVWVVPGSHVGRADIAGMCAQAGSDRLPDAVPLVCAPGDVAICNRQAVHGSFANTSPDPRVTINFGFNRRRSILDKLGNGIHSPRATYDADRILERSRLIGYAIDARRERFPDEAPYDYAPLADRMDEYRYTPEARAGLKDYNLLDLGI